MRRLRHLLAVAAVTAALVVVPFAGSAFADPLPPGAYDVEIDDDGTGVTLEVLDDGNAIVTADEGVEVALTYDEDGAVQDVFFVRTAEGVVEIEIDVDDDGWVATVTPTGDDDFPEDEPESDDDADDADDDADDASDDEIVFGDVSDDETKSDDDADDADDDDATDEADEDETDEDEADETHGDVVSTVAACAPSGRDAREAGLPNHGSIVSQVARGDVVTVEGLVGEFVVTDAAGAEALCAALDDAVEAAAAAAEAEEADSSTDEDGDDRPGNGNGRDKGERGNNGNGNGRDKERGGD